MSHEAMISIIIVILAVIHLLNQIKVNPAKPIKEDPIILPPKATPVPFVKLVPQSIVTPKGKPLMANPKTATCMNQIITAKNQIDAAAVSLQQAQKALEAQGFAHDAKALNSVVTDLQKHAIILNAKSESYQDIAASEAV